MTTHLPGVEGARIVRTRSFDELDELAEFALPRHGIIVVDGLLGVGKTVLTDHFVNDHPQPVAVIALPPRQSSRDIVRWLHRTVCDGDDSDELPERDIPDDLVDRLHHPHTVVVRNIQRLTTEAAGQIEWLHSHPNTNWTLVLEGGPGTTKAVQRDPLLGHRIAGHLTVPTLSDRGLLDVLQALYPVLLSTSPELLLEIDARACHGVLRNWTRFLQVALHLRDQVLERGGAPPVIDRRFARAVLQKLPATPPPKKKS